MSSQANSVSLTFISRGRLGQPPSCSLLFCGSDEYTPYDARAHRPRGARRSCLIRDAAVDSIGLGLWQLEQLIVLLGPMIMILACVGARVGALEYKL